MFYYSTYKYLILWKGILDLSFINNWLQYFLRYTPKYSNLKKFTFFKVKKALSINCPYLSLSDQLDKFINGLDIESIIKH